MKKSSLEQVIADLEALPAEMVIAICAALLVTHHPFNCRRVVHNIEEDFESENASEA